MRSCLVVDEQEADVAWIGYTAETDASGKERWPRGDESVWNDGTTGLTKGTSNSLCAYMRALC